MEERTDYCGNITEKYVGQKVSLDGWVQRRRDLGGLVFVDLRDYKGIVQCGREHTLIVKKPMHVGELVLLISFDIAILCVALFLSFRQLKISSLGNEKETNYNEN